MDIVPKFIDLARTPQEIEEDISAPVVSQQPLYPYGLRICLGQDELEKLGMLGEEMPEVSDVVHGHFLATVTSVSKNVLEDGSQNNRIEMQITMLAAEDEDEENQEVEQALNRKVKYT